MRYPAGPTAELSLPRSNFAPLGGASGVSGYRRHSAPRPLLARTCRKKAIDEDRPDAKRDRQQSRQPRNAITGQERDGDRAARGRLARVLKDARREEFHFHHSIKTRPVEILTENQTFSLCNPLVDNIRIAHRFDDSDLSGSAEFRHVKEEAANPAKTYPIS